MNIKRRVYDALNVLIALGLLKRNGNKILGKRGEETLVVRRSLQEERVAVNKDEAAVEERECLRREIRRKEEIVAQKRQMLLSLQQKSAAMKELQARNKAHPSYKPTIRLPFVALNAKPSPMEVE
jgi:hypothetical protein